MGKNSIFFLFLILAIAFFFRFWKLGEIPPGFYPDEAINANEAFFTLKNKDFKVFYPENYGREGLFIWLLSLSFSIFGVSISSAKIVPATIGFLTVIGIYLLAKEIFENSKSIPLFCAFFLAISFWHINFSRIDFRAILLPFILVFCFYFLFKALKKRLIFYSTLAGLFFGFGFYTYTSFRMAVLILPFLLLCLWLFSRKEKFEKKFFALIFVFLFVIFLVALPIGIHFLKNPEHFISRAAPVTIFKAEKPLEEFFKSLVLHLAMFNFYGDKNWRHNFSGSPMLFFPIGILFLIGIFISFRELISSIKLKNYFLLTVHCFLISSFFIMLLPGILTFEGIPHSLRTIGVLPFALLFAAIGAERFYFFLDRKIKNKKALNFGFLIFLLICALFEFQKYFFVWAKRPEVKSEFTKELVEMGKYLNSLPEDFEKYVIVNREGVPVSWMNNIPMPAQTIIFLEISKHKEIKSKYLLAKDFDKIKIEKRGVVLPLSFDQNLFEKLKEKFPQGKIKKVNEFFVYEVE